MKSFKEIRSELNEVNFDYYTGPTTYAGGDRTNVGDISGTDLGGLRDGRREQFPESSDMKILERALASELRGVHNDPVGAISKAMTKFSATGLVFEIDPMQVRTAAKSGNPFTTPLTFAGHPLGEAPDRDSANDFAAMEIGIVGQKGYEASLPETNVEFTFNPVSTGYEISVEFV
jgi:hypothetical protein